MGEFKHVKYIWAIMANKIRTLLCLRNFLPAKTSLLLYKTTILAHMDYAALILGSAGVTVLDELQDIQIKTNERLLKLKGLDDDALHRMQMYSFLIAEGINNYSLLYLMYWYWTRNHFQM